MKLKIIGYGFMLNGSAIPSGTVVDCEIVNVRLSDGSSWCINNIQGDMYQVEPVESQSEKSNLSDIIGGRPSSININF
jgi:hypothetical protein